MLVLDFINVGNGDAILVREVEQGCRRFAMLVDCGHDSLVRDDHTEPLDPRSRRIYAGDFLRAQGVDHLDVLLLTHFHRDHIGGLGRLLKQVTVERLLTPYLPPGGAVSLDPDGDNGLPKAARNLLRCMDLYALPLAALWRPGAGAGGALRSAHGDDPSDGGSDHGDPLWGAGPLSPPAGGV